MISQLTPYLNGDFDPDNAQNYHLLLGIGEKEFSYAVVETDTLIAFGTQLPITELDAPLNLGNANNVDYKQIIAGIVPRDFSIIPNELFQEDKANEFAKYLNIADSDKIFSQHLDSSNHIIFNCSAGLAQRIAQSYSSVMIHFLYKGWLQAIAKRQPFNENIFVDIQKGAVRIANFQDEKLRFYNRYIIDTKEDVVYYVALVAEELGIPKGDRLIVLSGDLTANDENVTALKAFFRQVEVSKISLLEHIPAETEPQQLLALSALQLCV